MSLCIIQMKKTVLTVEEAGNGELTYDGYELLVFMHKGGSVAKLMHFYTMCVSLR